MSDDFTNIKSLSYITVGDAVAKLIQTKEEIDTLHKAKHDYFIARILPHIVDDCKFILRTPWGPDAEITIIADLYSKDGNSISKKGNITIKTLCETPLPHDTLYSEWKTMLLLNLYDMTKSVENVANSTKEEIVKIFYKDDIFSDEVIQEKSDTHRQSSGINLSYDSATGVGGLIISSFYNHPITPGTDGTLENAFMEVKPTVQLRQYCKDGHLYEGSDENDLSTPFEENILIVNSTLCTISNKSWVSRFTNKLKNLFSSKV